MFAEILLASRFLYGFIKDRMPLRTLENRLALLHSPHCKPGTLEPTGIPGFFARVSGYVSPRVQAQDLDMQDGLRVGKHNSSSLNKALPRSECHYNVGVNRSRHRRHATGSATHPLAIGAHSRGSQCIAAG